MLINLFDKGGPLMWPLLLCSLLICTIVFERIYFWFGPKYKRLKKNYLETANSINQKSLLGGMQSGLGVLSTCVTIAPLLGILGTIVGIIESFGILSEQGIDNPQAVIAGISEALISTAVGLSIAIVAVIFLSLFQNRAEWESHSINAEVGT